MRCAGGNRMNDIPIRWSAESGAGDWSPDSAEVSDLQIAVMISLFTDRQARDYMTEALQWLIDDGAVARFEIDTGYSRSGRLDAQIIAYRQDGTTHAMRFEWAWPK